MDGAYTAVIPSLVRDIISDRPVRIYGDGKTSRDFCFIDNVIQANLLAATTDASPSFGRVFNVSSGKQISILELCQLIRSYFEEQRLDIELNGELHCDFRPSEIRHSHGDISQIVDIMGYSPSPSLREGLSITLDWYLENAAAIVAC